MSKYVMISLLNRHQCQCVFEAWGPAFVYPVVYLPLQYPKPIFDSFLDLLFIWKSLSIQKLFWFIEKMIIQWFHIRGVGWVSYNIPSKWNKLVLSEPGCMRSGVVKKEWHTTSQYSPPRTFDFFFQLLKCLTVRSSIDCDLFGHKINQQDPFPIPKDRCHDIPFWKLNFKFFGWWWMHMLLL